MFFVTTQHIVEEIISAHNSGASCKKGVILLVRHVEVVRLRNAEDGVSYITVEKSVGNAVPGVPLKPPLIGEPGAYGIRRAIDDRPYGF